MNPATAIATAVDALDLAQHGPTPDALDALQRALLTVASTWEITSVDDRATVATQRALDAAVAVRRANNPTATALALVAAADAVTTARAVLFYSV